MTRVVIREASIDPLRDQVFDNVENVGDFLYSHFKVWPKTAVLYRNEVSVSSEIPLSNENDVAALNRLEGDIYVVIYPASFLAVIGIALIAATVAIQLYINKDKSASANKAREIPEGSPNNSLSARTNRERLEQRIPDIYGKVRSFPDLIVATYKRYVGNEEIEYSYMSVGRGSYDTSDEKEGETPLDQITGTSIEIYGPNTSPNSGLPQKTVGSAINEPFLQVIQSNQVNGQTLGKPLNHSWFGYAVKLEFETRYRSELDESVYAKWHHKIAEKTHVSTNLVKLEEDFEVGGSVSYTGLIKQLQKVIGIDANGDPIYENITPEYNLDGTYTIANLYSRQYTVLGSPRIDNEMTLKSASLVNSEWGNYDLANNNPAEYRDSNGDWQVNIGGYNVDSIDGAGSLTKPNLKLGPYVVKDANSLMLNLVAGSGLYRDGLFPGETEQRQRAISVQSAVTVEELDDAGVPTGVSYSENVILSGNDNKRDQIAITAEITPGFVGKMRVSLERTLVFYTDDPAEAYESDNNFQGTTIDDIRWESLYSTKPITENHFGDITTVRIQAKATKGASAVKERKFNLLASRLVDYRESDGTFTPLTATSRFPDIVRAIALDPKIGNRTEAELDIDNLYDTYDAVIAEFGTSLVGEFNYTFDEDNLSFEETLAIIAEACFCTVYRQGSQIKFHFEKETPTSSLLFNHRNKVPNSEARTVNFGYLNEHDGIEIEYVDTDDGATLTVYLPSDQSAVNPEKIKKLGVTHKLQAYFHAWRNWNRIRYQNTVVQFDATQEAALLKINERVRVADNTRPTTYDGEIVSQDSLTLKLSQPFEFEAGKSYTIFLQNVDGTVEGIGISPGPMTNEVILDQASSQPLALAADLYARATYEIVENSSNRSQAFLIEEKNPNDSHTFKLRAVNYDDRYYQNDTDFIDNVVDADGNLI